MDTIRMIKSGMFDIEKGEIPSHVVTAVSNVFVFNHVVYKIYKNDNDFFNKNFNDLSVKNVRFDFTRRDFDWNNKVSPEVYIDLRGLVVENGLVKLVDPSDSVDELVIVMNKVNMSDCLINRLVNNSISTDDVYEIGFQLGKRVSSTKKVFPDNLYNDFLSRYNDLVNWTNGVKELPKEEVAQYVNFYKNYVDLHREEFETSINLMGLCMDLHADNIVYSNNTLLCMDTYSPKEAWLHGYKYLNIYRVATDIYAFLGKEAFEKVLLGYADATDEKLPRQHDKFLIMYCELIVWPYQYMLIDKDPWRKEVADKYHHFIKQIFNDVS